MKFEKRKPEGKELIIIANLCALAVIGRLAFFMVPQFKPVVAIVMITGIGFGREAGFLVGAMSGFVSNFFFGQGPWTPWQMFCFGLIGFIAGLAYEKGWLKTGKWRLAIFGAIATLVIYGGIINLGALLMWSSHFSWKALGAMYLTGLPFDLIHAGSTFIFLLLLSEFMLEKIDRIKIKYAI